MVCRNIEFFKGLSVCVYIFFIGIGIWGSGISVEDSRWLRKVG